MVFSVNKIIEFLFYAPRRVRGVLLIFLFPLPSMAAIDGCVLLLRTLCSLRASETYSCADGAPLSLPLRTRKTKLFS